MTQRTPEPRILYVEDNKLIQVMMVSILADEGFDLLVADDAAQALHHMASEKKPIDGLLTDVNLGTGPDGWDVSRCARLRRPALPVVYTSSVSEEEWIAKGVPFSRLCQKPFKPSHVIEALSSLLAEEPDRPDHAAEASLPDAPEAEAADECPRTASSDRPWTTGGGGLMGKLRPFARRIILH